MLLCLDSISFPYLHGGDLQSNGVGRSRVFLGGGLLQLFGADPTSVGKVLAGGSQEHLEGETSVGMVREVAEEGWSGTDCLRRVLPCSGPGSANIWVENLGVYSSDVT